MTNSRIAAVDVGNDSIKAIFGKLDSELNIPNVIARDVEDRPVIGIEELDSKNPLEGIHIRVHSPALKENNAIYRVGHLATKSDNATELDPGSSKSEEDQTLVMLFSALALDAVQKDGSTGFKKSGNVIDANYTLGTGLPLREVKEGKDAGYRSKLLGSVHQVEFLVTPKYQGQKVNIKFDEIKVYPEGFAAYINLVMDNNLNIINKDLIDKRILIQDIGGLSTDIAVIKNRNVDDDKAQGFNLGVSEALESIREEIRSKHGVELDSRRDVVEIITKKNDRNHIMVKGSRTSVHDITDRILLDLAKKQYRLLRNVWQKNSQTEICYFVGGGSIVLKDYLKTLNNNLDGYNIDFFEDEKESIWMMANAYYKLISDFSRRTNKDKADQDKKPVKAN
ncbi:MULTISPECIES: ParM/StbA family protein [Cytobacillus]|uniref:ParM/StbA family protein n=1 Tax=Cytobacillus pseudoceanisediminis TaxID=3051614 RepID=A0ABZ2ZJT3_9BACI|nr:MULTISPECIES: ParM/StbA family protein [Cytobacillus]MBY0157790.1 ParM/StbA family protein [Cytobacillus firmus]MBU8772466.1 ParM/StbA family protein [Cytobacillus oceanisediminis]MCM3243837.1 ParM/StbA family protein [Cytobacillus oceanisediminis]MCM3391793.1 ParM/StbA family protein [Cytobacillus oceanisediminis]MCM3402343.1 ParM/StbA family protein [Cytobacillus oceanisediminis]